MASAALRFRPTPANSILFICDVQERFRPLIHNMPTVIAQTSFLNDVCRTLKVPRLATEQYPKALGNLVPELVLEEDVPKFSKMQFSMLVPEVRNVLTAKPDIRNILLCGIETHVCVQQTTLDLLEAGYNVHLICDALSSQKPYDRTVALQKMRDSGAVLTTASSIAFELMRAADHASFKAISNLVKAARSEEFKDQTTL
eukprot:gene1107-1205_t